MKISHLAYYILENYSSVKGGITPLKLQKLLYYTKVWGLVSGEIKVDAQFKAWKNGPVNGYVYHEFKEFGDQPIPVVHKDGSVSLNKKKLIDFILESYAHYDVVTLCSKTQQEDPWKKAEKNEVISDQAVEEFYSKQPFANNFPIIEDKPYYPVYTDFMYSFTLDFEEGDKAKEIVFDSFKEYKQMMKKSKEELVKHFALDTA